MNVHIITRISFNGWVNYIITVLMCNYTAWMRCFFRFENNVFGLVKYFICIIPIPNKVYARIFSDNITDFLILDIWHVYIMVYSLICLGEHSKKKNVTKSGKSPQFSWPPPPPLGSFGLFWIWEKFESSEPPLKYGT